MDRDPELRRLDERFALARDLARARMDPTAVLAAVTAATTGARAFAFRVAGLGRVVAQAESVQLAASPARAWSEVGGPALVSEAVRDLERDRLERVRLVDAGGRRSRLDRPSFAEIVEQLRRPCDDPPGSDVDPSVPPRPTSPASPARSTLVERPQGPIDVDKLLRQRGRRSPRARKLLLAAHRLRGEAHPLGTLLDEVATTSDFKLAGRMVTAKLLERVESEHGAALFAVHPALVDVELRAQPHVRNF